MRQVSPDRTYWPVRLPSPRPGPLQMLHRGVGAGEDKPHMPVVGPSHEVWRAAVGPPDLDDLSVPVGLADVVTLDHQTISYARFHGSSFSLLLVLTQPGPIHSVPEGTIHCSTICPWRIRS